MRTIVAAIAALAMLGVATDATAQSKKKSSNEDQQQQSTNSGGYPKCEGTLFLVYDSGSGPSCRRRDGKVCEVAPDTSGRANLVNCR